MNNSLGQPKYITIIVIILLIVLAFCPIFIMFIRSFWVDGVFSISAYSKYFLTKRQLGLLKNALLLAFGTCLFSLAIGVPFGILVSRTNIYFKEAFRYLYLAPLLIPPYISTKCWIHILGKNAWLNRFLVSFFSLSSPIFSVYSMWGGIWILGLSYFPFVTLLTTSGLSSIDKQMEEAASLTHGQLGVLRRITIPLIIPYIFAGIIFVFIFSFINFGVPALLEIHTYPIEIFAQFSSYRNENAAIVFTLPLILITMGLILIQKYYMGRRSYVVLTYTEKNQWDLKKWKVPAFIFVCMILFLSFFSPVLDLVITAGSFQSYIKAWQTSYKQIGFTMLWSAIAATVMIIIGFFISYYIERIRNVKANIIDTFSIVLFAIPGTALGIGMIRMWNTPFTQFIYGGSIIILFAFIARYIPFMIRGISASLKQICIDVEEAAALTGRGWLSRIYHIVIPLASQGMIAGWLITFVLCLGELDAVLLVMPPGKASLAIRIYNLMHYGASKIVAALCLILLLISIIGVFAILFIKWMVKKMYNKNKPDLSCLN